MIATLECQHGKKLRWSQSHKGYVPVERDHKVPDCFPAISIIDGKRTVIRRVA